MREKFLVGTASNREGMITIVNGYFYAGKYWLQKTSVSNIFDVVDNFGCKMSDVTVEVTDKWRFYVFGDK